MQRFFAESLFDGNTILKNQMITVEAGTIRSIESAQLQDDVIQLSGLVAPGFVDVQVNGGGGVLFNNQPNLETLLTMSRAHQQFGSTAILPTLITDDFATMQQAANAVAAAIAQNVKGIIGIHFEGPHLSQPKKGIHPIQHIRQISPDEMALFKRTDLGLVCVTLAPENVPVEIIKELVQANVKVCLGHSNASAAQTFAALQAGAQGFTHLFNAMSPLQSRAAGMVGAALLDATSYCGLIVDHEHVDMTSCQLAIKCKTPNRIMLVTDAMSHVGSEQIELQFAGMQINRQGNKLTIEGGRLAGSALDMASAVRHCVQDLQCSIEDAIKMASTTPATFLGLQQQKGYLASGFAADWVVLTDQYYVNASYIAGEQVFG
ncbi:N-acetylglucosamine-6-phosphate deacetylase [Paraglaciecola sp. MB-3u-78]|jgi:N-acetylglucosamine-6-phosphate deacetylase|uniref:N-acetylglucosamine-6-phosphate deacetylase n=1 Tax=Paraglaciecola sp. MB-3u-78 TaxID=2058332 RepID=UPI000C330893|nr:N-acetylglucosamine-6-phosphate deacetylase [Paraglaciecola sp. MB-3u-78]PKG98172.1 N-acetylglucosamine-6-phosphate deacetylase [Paraglaciecola sp. MB-3u-78]